jgi:septum formation protein
LASLGIPFVVLPGNIAEELLPGERPPAYLERIALGKLAAVQSLLEQRGPGLPAAAVSAPAVLVADTIVVLDEEILGKPLDVADAAAILSRLVGRTHTVFTRYILGSPLAEAGAGGGVYAARTVATAVKLRAASTAEVRAYAATGEGLDKAGAYAAQGIGAFLVEAVEGSYTNVVGLPACEVVADLLRLALLADFPARAASGGGA